MSKLERFDDTGTARFITISCYHNLNLLKTQFAKLTFTKYLKLTRHKYGLKLYGYVIMPNHVHLVLLPQSGDKIAKIIGELKSLPAREILHNWRLKGYSIINHLGVVRNGRAKHAFWQRRFYDHNCRSPEIVLEKINYCHNNPVKSGLVDQPGDWRWSSYRWYHGLKGIEIEMDEFEL